MTINIEPYSWIPSDFAWEHRNDSYILQTTLADQYIVKLMATGSSQVHYFSSVAVAESFDALNGKNNLEAQLIRKCNAERKELHDNPEISSHLIELHWYGSYLLPDKQTIMVIVGKNPPDGPLPSQLQTLAAAASELYKTHMKMLDAFKQDRACREANYAVLTKGNPDCPSFEFGETLFAPPEPLITAESLSDKFPKAVSISTTYAADIDSITEEMLHKASESGWNAPRDGSFRIISCCDGDNTKRIICTWQPHEGLPSYQELRWAIQKTCPVALASPRETKCGRPVHLKTQKKTKHERIYIEWPEEKSWAEALKDVDLDDINYDQRVAATRQELEKNGIEAIAWYQPFHIWSESTWGIYLDAQKLDDLALTLMAESKALVARSQSAGGRLTQDQAAQLAFGLIYHHEMFPRLDRGGDHLAGT